MSGPIAGRGASLPHAFAEIGLALFGQVVHPDRVDPREVRELRAHGQTLESLLLAWIGECHYVHEIEGFVCQRIEMVVFETAPGGGAEPLRLHAVLHGEAIDPARHGEPGVMQAVSQNGASVERVPTGYEVRVSAAP